MKLKFLTHDSSSTPRLIIAILLITNLTLQTEAEIDANLDASNDNAKSDINPSLYTSQLDEEYDVILEECAKHLEGWMDSVSTNINKENATLVVDWSDLDQQLSAKSCPYDQLWIELWRVNDDKITSLDNKNTEYNENIPNSGSGIKETIGTREYFSKYQRCNSLNENFFSYHSTHAHNRGGKRYSKVIAKAGEEKEDGGLAAELHEDEDNDTTDYIVSVDSEELVARDTLDSATSTTFLHVVEQSYILRLCPCGKIRKQKDRNICDCEYTDAFCSEVITIQQPPELEVYPWCRETSSNLAGTEQNIKLFSPDMEKLSMKSPQATCGSVLLAGSLTPCTPVQDYDRVKVS